MKFPEHRRYEYDLDHNSIVFDLGFYEGTFSKNMYQKYGCQIYSFEPIKAFCDLAASMPYIKLYNYGVGGYSRHQKISLQKDASSIFLESDISEIVLIKSIDEVLSDLNVNHIDLIKINIEGCEFELLERILSLNIQNQMRNIQVQFHKNVDNSKLRRSKIRKKLQATHKLTYDFPFLWENWELHD